MILSQIFKGGPNPDSQILDDLSDMKNTLDDIENKLTALESQLKTLETELNIKTSDIETLIVKQGLDKYTSKISSAWDQYSLLYNPDSKTWITDPDKLAAVAFDTLVTDDIFSQLIGIHNALTGEHNSGSIFEKLEENVALKVNDSGDPLQYFYVIESYFGKVLKSQTRGATLMVEAIRYANESGNNDLKKHVTMDATTFMKWYRSHIEDQVENYLAAVEHFIVDTADLTSGFTAFVPHADIMFKRADLAAGWLSRKHRPDPQKAPDKQNLFVYRVIGGPQRVEQYPDQWSREGSNVKWNRMIYDKGTQDPVYDVPVYDLAKNHDLPAKQSYIQYHHHEDQQDLISEAKTITISKYYSADFMKHKYLGVTFFLDDFCCRSWVGTWVSPLNSRGKAPDKGDSAIMYGHVLDIQQMNPRAWGNWKTRHSHNSHHGLKSMEYHCDGGAPQSREDLEPWSSLKVDAWPTWSTNFQDPEDMGNVSGHFLEEQAVEGHYTWVGETAPKLTVHYTAHLKRNWELDHKAAPGDQSWGLYAWLEGGKDHDDKYHDTSMKDGTHNYSHSLDIRMEKGKSFYISFGCRMKGDWKNTYTEESKYHHWKGELSAWVRDLYFTL